MKIVFIYPDESKWWDGVEWRCRGPASAINRTGRHTASLVPQLEFVRNSTAAQHAIEPCDVLVVHRGLWGGALSRIQHWQARDKVVIADFEDAYQLMTGVELEQVCAAESGPTLQRGPAIAQVPPPLMQFKWGIQLVNAASVPSKRLADDWRSYTRVEIVPNYISLEKYLNVSAEPHPGVVLGWRGRSSQLRRFYQSGLLTAIKEVMAMRPQLKLAIFCDQPEKTAGLGLPPEQLVALPWTAETDWPRQLTKVDIGLAPLDGDFDQRENWGLVLEYLAMKIPWIGSLGSAYHDLRSMGWQVENLPEAWARVLLEMVDHLGDYRAETAMAPFLFCMGQSLDENVYRLIDTYARVAGSRPGWMPEGGTAREGCYEATPVGIIRDGGSVR